MSPLISRRSRFLAPLVLAALFLPGAGTALAQEPPTPSGPPPAPENPAAKPAPVPVEPAADEGANRPKPFDERLLPRLDVLFPEGDLDLRVNRLINKVFFEGQVKYNFIKGDISAFLRYRYYGYQRVTQLSVFDTIEFQGVQRFSNDFDRVRGSLLLMQWPTSFNKRTFGLVELDRISSNREDVAQVLRLGRTNTFVRLGYQIGTPEDSPSNALVGEARAITQRLFTAYREIGPGGAGITSAVTYGFPLGIGDFDYLKAETEALKRFDVSERTFLIGRVHAGSFLKKGRRSETELPANHDPLDIYSIPTREFFHLDGSDHLKGLKDDRPGTELLYTTWEYFFPWFLDAHHQFLRLEWQSWYWILYAGSGTAGFDRKIYSNFGTYVTDAGIGFESSFTLRKYRFFLSGIVAQALQHSKGGVEARFSVKSYH